MFAFPVTKIFKWAVGDKSLYVCASVTRLTQITIIIIPVWKPLHLHEGWWSTFWWDGGFVMMAGQVLIWLRLSAAGTDTLLLGGRKWRNPVLLISVIESLCTLLLGCDNSYTVGTVASAVKNHGFRAKTPGWIHIWTEALARIVTQCHATAGVQKNVDAVYCLSKPKSTGWLTQTVLAHGTQDIPYLVFQFITETQAFLFQTIGCLFCSALTAVISCFCSAVLAFYSVLAFHFASHL